MRIRPKYVLPIALMLMLPGIVSAQVVAKAPLALRPAQPAPLPPGDPRSPEALAIIAKSLAAMTPPGSSLDGSAITTVQASGTIDKLNLNGEGWTTGTFNYIDDLNAQKPEYKRSIVFAGKTQAYTSNHGTPSGSDDYDAGMKKQPETYRRIKHRKFEAEYMPYILLYQVSARPGISVYSLGSFQLEGKTCIRIETIRVEHDAKDANGTHVSGEQNASGKQIRRDWFLDPDTMLPIASMELLPAKLPGMAPVMQRITYSAYQPMGGLLCPTEQSMRYNSMELGRIHVKSVEINTPVRPAMFDAPAVN